MQLGTQTEIMFGAPFLQMRESEVFGVLTLPMGLAGGIGLDFVWLAGGLDCSVRGVPFLAATGKASR